MTLIHFSRSLKEPEWCGGGPHNFEISKQERAIYPAKLCDLIDGCLAFEPQERLTLEHLQSEIAKIIAEDDYMRKAAAGQQQEEDQRHELFYGDKTEKYKLGWAYP